MHLEREHHRVSGGDEGEVGDGDDHILELDLGGEGQAVVDSGLAVGTW